jgi:hypothetical protein
MCACAGANTRRIREFHLVALNFAFGVIFKVPIALVPSFHDLAELVCESGVEEVVDA